MIQSDGGAADDPLKLGHPHRLKVLISAYACVPGEGSEHGVGWNVAAAVAEHHDVWLLTKPRAAITEELERRPVPGLRLVPYDLPAWLRWIRGLEWIQVYYYLWQLGAIGAARRAHAEVGFDLTHHVTFVKYWVPAAAAFVDAPFVWGPVGGGESMPVGFVPSLSLRARAFEHVRLALRSLAELDPVVRATARRARLAVATTPETAQRLRRLVRCEVTQLPELALGEDDLEELSKLHHHEPNPETVFLSVGRLVGWKGYHLSLQAFARAHLPRARYVIVGTGPELPRLKALAERLGIGARVDFLGTVPRGVVLERLRAADVFVHPSLHDSGGWATVEAMAAYKPVVCFDLGGPGVQTTDETSVKLEALGPEEAVREMAEAFTNLAADPGLRERLGAAARERVEHEFTWRGRGRALSAIYAWVLRAAKP